MMTHPTYPGVYWYTQDVSRGGITVTYKSFILGVLRKLYNDFHGTLPVHILTNSLERR